MIDLHCHILPGIDDGPPDIGVSVAMARMAVADGISHVACTSHITPGIYNNTAEGLDIKRLELAAVLEREGIALALWPGADVHIAPDLSALLNQGLVPTLGSSRYFLFEPPHHVVPPRIDETVKVLLAAGFVPLITHPERLGWIESHYDLLCRLVGLGALVQVTAGSITGEFGRRAQSLSERMLDDGLVDIIATDAHNVTSRPPILSRARDVVAARLGEAEALNMVWERPAAMLRNEDIPRRPKAISPQVEPKAKNLRLGVKALFGRLRG